MKAISLSTELKKVIDDTTRVASYLWEKGWAERNAGNISVNITEFVNRSKSYSQSPKIPLRISSLELSGHCFLITTTGSRFRDLVQQPEKNLLIIYIANKLDGYHILWGGKGLERRPTSEFISHLKIQAFLLSNNLPQKVILHTHPTQLTALTHIEQYNREDALNHLLWSMHPEVKIVLPEGADLAPYRCPGSAELAEATVKALEHHRVVLWEKHGCLAIGTDVFEAFDLIDTANKAAEIFFICQSAGFKPSGLSKEQIVELTKFPLMKEGIHD